MALFYAMRVDMSIAIICMVNHTAVGDLELAKMGRMNTTTPLPAALDPRCGVVHTKKEVLNEDGPYVWDSYVQNQILGAFFYGYPILMVPGGYLAGSYGGRWIIFGCMFFLSIATVLVPFIGGHWIVQSVFRALQGLASGAWFPAAHSIVSHWAPPLERSKFTTIAYAGTQLGNVFTFPISGFLCHYLSWQWIFFVWGGIGFAWLIIWFFFGYNKPSEHPRATQSEKQYIIKAIGTDHGEEKISFFSIPWLKIITSPPVWGIFLANFTSDWGAYTFMTQTPRYMKSVHGFDIKSNATLSAVPYIAYWFFITISGPLADLMRKHNCLSTVWVRRVFSLSGFMLPSILCIILGYLSCEYWILAFVVLVAIIGLSGLQYASWVVSHVDIAPKYAGILYGICNSISCASGILTTTVSGLFMSAEPSLEEWRLLFFLTAGIMGFGSMMYCILIRADLQPWAIDKEQSEKE